MLTDEQLREAALAKFQSEAFAKFTAGIEEHNPEGLTHLCRLKPLQLVGEMKKEAIDQFFYACALEEVLKNESGNGQPGC